MPIATLSVLIPNYNHGSYISHCLDQIFCQEFPPTEVIVVDDGSTDDSAGIIARYASREPRLRFCRNRKNLGVMETMKRALRLASGDYVYGGAADDWVAPGTFQKTMDLLRRYPQAGLCFGNVSQFHADSGRIYPLRNPICSHERFFSPDEITEAFFRASRPGDSIVVPGNGAVWKRAEFIRAGGYQESLRWYGDWFTLQVVALRNGACFIPECLAFTRVDRRSFSFAGQRNWQEQRLVLDRMIKLLKTQEFNDVLPRFQKGHFFSQMVPGIVRVIVSQPEHWDRDSALLIQNALPRWWRTFLLNKDPLVRQGMLTCLGHVRPAAMAILPALLSFLRSKPRTREPVKLALRTIVAGAPSPWPVYCRCSAEAAVRRLAGLGIRAYERIRALAASMYRVFHWKLYRRIQALEDRIAEARMEEGLRSAETLRQLQSLREDLARLTEAREEWGAASSPDACFREPIVAFGPRLPLAARQSFGTSFRISRSPDDER